MPSDRSNATKFVADAMLGSLARKLRALGFDTEYFRTGTDSEVAEIAASQGRVLLTADRALASRARGGRFRAILLAGSSDSARVASLSVEAHRQGVRLISGDSRCSVCNGELRRLTKSEAAGRVPGQVLSRHRLFFSCRECGKEYWRGGHWKKLRSLRRRLRQNHAAHSRRRPGGGPPRKRGGGGPRPRPPRPAP